MAALPLPNADEFQLWALTFARMSGVVALLPAGSALNLMRVRIALVVVLTLLVGANTGSELEAGRATLPIAIQEFALGVGYGFGIRVMFMAAQVVAELLMHSSGLAQVAWQHALGGHAKTGIPRFLELTFVATLLAGDGHRMLVANLLQTFVDIPVGAFDATACGLHLLFGFLTRALELGVYSSFPLLASAGIAIVATAVIHRLVPQLGSLIASAGLGYVILIVTLMIGIGALSGMFERGIRSYAEEIQPKMAFVEGN